jgi:hypothetical protein
MTFQEEFRVAVSKSAASTREKLHERANTIIEIIKLELIKRAEAGACTCTYTFAPDVEDLTLLLVRQETEKWGINFARPVLEERCQYITFSWSHN